MKSWRTILSWKLTSTLPEVGDYIKVKVPDPTIMRFDYGVIGKVIRVDRESDVLEVRFEGWGRNNRRLETTWTLHNLDKFDEYYEIVL